MTGGIGLPTGSGSSTNSNVSYLSDKRRGQGGQPPSDGGDPPDMNARIERLEAGHATILTKLDAIATSIADSRLETEKRFSSFDKMLIKLEERLNATATEVNLTNQHGQLNEKIAKLDGRVSSIPTTWQTIAIIATLLIGITGIAFTISRLGEASRQGNSTLAPNSSSTSGKAP